MDDTSSMSTADASHASGAAPGAAEWPESATHWLEALPQGSVRIGRFTVLERIAAGGMGVVYAAYDSELDRKVAIKVIREESASETVRARIVREARAMAKLSHPNVAQVFEVGEHLGSTFIAMEFVQGVTLRQWQREERRSWREVLAVYLQAGRGLAAAHAAGLVHRDFKPDNAMIGRDGRVRVLDFGLVRADDTRSFADTDGEPDRAEPESAGFATLTKTGSMLGTPAYMAPEQFLRQTADHRTDQFALCVSLWEGLHGERPFEGTTRAQLFLNVMAASVRQEPKGAMVPAWVRAVLVRGLSVEPPQRFPSLDALLAALEDDPSRRRRRALALGLGVAAVVLVLGGLALDRARRVQACEDEAASITEVWDDAARERTRASLLGSGASYAPSTWERVEPGLDAYAEEWSHARASTCLAARVEGTRPEDLAERTSACLGERREALAALVEVLAEADEPMTRKAVISMTSLPAVEECTDDARLVRWMQPPAVAEVRARAIELRTELTRVRQRAAAEGAADALASARELVLRAEALGWGPLRAEALLLEGRLAARGGEPRDGETALEQAVKQALREGHDEVALEAMTFLAFTVGHDLGRPERALWWGDLALALAARLGSTDDVRVARILTALGATHQRAGTYAEMRSCFEGALRIFEAELGPEHPEVARGLDNLAGYHQLMGEHAEAIALLERSLAIRKVALGPDHPSLATTLETLGNVRFERGAYAEAKTLLEESLALREATFGPRHSDVASSLVNLARIHRVEKEPELAQARYEQAISILEEVYGPEHPRIAMALYNLGVLRSHMGAAAEAERLFERALAMQEEALGPEHVDVARSHYGLANLRMSMGAHAEAKASFERALAIRERVLGPEHADVASSLLGLGVLHLAMDEPAEARPIMERSLEVYEKALGAEHPSLGYPLTALADLALAQGRAADAVPLAERAVALREAGASGEALLAESRFGLAKALHGAGLDRSRARALAEQARDGYRAVGRLEELAEVEAWLAGHASRTRP